jgi:hypothetical protein
MARFKVLELRLICTLHTGVVNAIVAGGITDSLRTGVAMAVQEAATLKRV